MTALRNTLRIMVGVIAAYLVILVYVAYLWRAKKRQ
jgi:hypothetical protein